MKKRNAFTLAEVLITLGIIGIVAAITLPVIIQKNLDKQLISRTKKVYSDVNNALLAAQNDYGVVGDNSFLFNSQDSDIDVVQNFQKYLIGSKICRSKSQTGCASYYYDIKFATLRLTGEGGGADVYNQNKPKIILSNGAIVALQNSRKPDCKGSYTANKTDEYGRPTDDVVTVETSYCGYIVFDVNGVQNPNQFGRDAYLFYVYKNKLVPHSAMYGSASFNNIITGKDKLEYKIYSKGQIFEF